MKARYAYIWEFKVRPDSLDRFISVYGPMGDWVRLFRQAKGYIRTELHRDLNRPERFVTVDHWASKADCMRFRKEFAGQIEGIDRLGEKLTESEEFLGDFSTASS